MKSVYDKIILEIDKIVEEGHKNQFRNNSKIPYFTHCLAVRSNTLDLLYKKENIHKFKHSIADYLIYSIVSIAHDLKEDNINYYNDIFIPKLNELIKEGLTLYSNIPSDHLYDNIVNAIDAITKDPLKIETITEYLNRVCNNRYSIIVKVADLNHNISNLKPGNLLDKYILCLYYIHQIDRYL